MGDLLVSCWRAATVTPGQARQLLRQPDAAAVLVDIRSAQRFRSGTPGRRGELATRPDAGGATGLPDLPAALRDKTLLLIDDAGWDSLVVARQLRRSDAGRAQRARRDPGVDSQRLAPAAAETIPPLAIGDGAVSSLPFREPVLASEVVSVTAFFCDQADLYAAVARCVIVLLWRETSPDLAALRWGMIFFFVGENACALNVLGFQETSYLLEYLHSAGMAVCLGFVAYAVMDGLGSPRDWSQRAASTLCGDESVRHSASSTRTCLADCGACSPC